MTEICFREAIVPLPVGDSFFGQALFETLLLGMTHRSLGKTPHLWEVFGRVVRDSHLRFRCQSEATEQPERTARGLFDESLIKGY